MGRTVLVFGCFGKGCVQSELPAFLDSEVIQALKTVGQLLVLFRGTKPDSWGVMRIPPGSCKTD